jgi:uncharacterized membrane protein YeaQ/YmgE (transglycosylase-associated protein family)
VDLLGDGLMLRWLATHPSGWIVILLVAVGGALIVVVVAVFG